MSGGRRTRLLAAAVGIVFLAPSPIYTITGWAGGSGLRGDPVLVLLLAAAVAAIHLRHSAAAVRGSRPTGWRWTLLALIALVYGPIAMWSFNWASMQPFVLASAALLLRPPAVGVIFAVALAGTSILAGLGGVAFGPAAVVAIVVFWISGLTLGGASLWGSVRLVRVTDEQGLARAELAEAAVGRERLRVSRDLHDLLGQSLAAVSLKGDLARALLHRDPAGARAEIAGIADVARDAVQGLQAITRDEHTVSLSAEADGAAALLGAAGIETRVVLDHACMDRSAEQLLAWAVREGVTNVLRHSDATTCTIDVDRHGTDARLVVVNDGVRRGPGTADGSGLAGLADRAATLGGTVSGDRDADRFRLVVTVPLERGPLERGPLERGPLERGPLERGPLERGPLERGPLERGPLDRAVDR